MRRVVFAVLVLSAGLVLCLPTATRAQVATSSVAVSSRVAPLPEAELSALRAATEKYRDVAVALADGYLRDPSGMCVTAAMEGAPRQLGSMGVHYFRPDLVGLAGMEPRVHGTGVHVDFRMPAVLIYEPQADGSNELVAIENLVWVKPWRDAGGADAPSYQGYDYYYMHDNPETPIDEAHGFEPHYELHLWLYRDNPNGMFAPFNPNVSCEHNPLGAQTH